MQQDASKKRSADIAGIVSAGLNRNIDDVFIESNVINLSSYDPSFRHGAEANFHQARSQQIVGSTARSEVGIVSATIHTKSLPIFQPQVKIGDDVDALIYEVGLSASWSGCLFGANLEGTPLQCDPALADADEKFGSQRPTFWNDGNASILVRDSFGQNFFLPLTYNTIKHTLLKVLLKNMINYSHPLNRYTPLIPVVTPSVYTPLITLGPLVTVSGNNFGGTRAYYSPYATVKSAEGFKIGDYVRVFGSYQETTSNGYTSSTDAAARGYTRIVDICTMADLASRKVQGISQNLSFESFHNLYASLTDYALILEATDSLTTFDLNSPTFRYGYIVNLQTDARGGTVNYLTDEFEFRPKTVQLRSSQDVTSGNTLTVRVSTTDTAWGFFRGNAGSPWNGVIQIQSEYSYLNGFYLRSSFSGASGTYDIVLTPLNHNIPSQNYNSNYARLSLAANGYSFYTELSGQNTTRDIQSMLFMRTMGYKPSSISNIISATYPPTATSPQNSWKRAYSADFTFSSYKGLRWTTQDVAPTPQPPKTVQDFTNGGVYYNVYDFNRFLTDSVNPAFQSIIFGETEQATLDEDSLQLQLISTAVAYQSAFIRPMSELAWSASTNYIKANVVIKDGFIFIANAPHRGSDPSQDLTQRFWRNIGVAKSYEPDLNNLVFVDIEAFGSSVYACPASLNDTIQPDLIVPTQLPVFSTNAPQFSYSGITGLMSYSADSYSFGDTFNHKTISLPNGGYRMDYFNTNYSSWGYQNGSGNNQGEEHFIIESNSSFKFLADNFPVYAVNYIEPTTNDNLIYWIWSTYSYDNTLGSITGTEMAGRGLDYAKRVFTQSVESLSSCLCPIQSIVVVSKSTPVVPTLIAPAQYVSDTNTAIAITQVISGDTQNIIGEFFIDSPLTTRSVIQYHTENPTFYSMQNTKVFKNFDYSLFYRHRISQQLVPLILTNYGSANIKFVFRPTSD